MRLGDMMEELVEVMMKVPLDRWRSEVSTLEKVNRVLEAHAAGLPVVLIVVRKSQIHDEMKKPWLLNEPIESLDRVEVLGVESLKAAVS